MNTVNNNYHILDTGGLLLRRYFGANDKSVETDNGNGKPVPDWRVGFLDFVRDVLLPLLRQGVSPSEIIACFDSGNNYRRKIFPAYKQHRRDRELSPEQREQTDQLLSAAKTFLAHLGCKVTWAPGEEADDLVALLCQKLDGMKVVYTHDSDLLELVAPDVMVWRMGELHTHEQPNYKIPYHLIPLYKSLVGSQKENYTGVPGVGAKTWQNILTGLGEAGLEKLQNAIDQNSWGDLTALFSDTSPIKVRLLEYWSTWRICWRLAKLAPEACYGEHRGAAKRPQWLVRVPSKGRVRDVLATAMEYAGPFETAEQEALLDNFNAYFPTERLLTTDNHQELVAAVKEMMTSPIVAYDFETVDRLKHQNFQKASDKNYVDVLSQELTGISFNYGRHKEHTVYVPFDHKDTKNYPKDWAKWLLSAIDGGVDRPVAQNAAFELTVRATNFPDQEARAPFDTMIMSSYVDENEEAHLKLMAKRVLNYRQASYLEVTQGRTMDHLTGLEVLSYGCDDSLVTAHLFDLYRVIMQIEGSWDFYAANEVEPVVNDVLSFVEGIDIDFDKLKVMHQETKEAIKADADTIVQTLALHCSPDRVDQGKALNWAKALLAEWWLTEKLKFPATEEGQAKAQARYQMLWQQAWEACFFVDNSGKQSKPIKELSIDPVGIVPTLTTINRVAAELDPQAPKLDKLTKSAIVNFEADLVRYAKQVEGSEGLLQLARLVTRAQSRMTPAKRTGPDYEALRDFCSDVLGGYVGHKKVQPKSIDGLNFGSPKQMQGMLYGKLGLPVRRRSKVTPNSTREKHKLPGSSAVGIKAIAAAMVYDCVNEEDWRRDVLQAYHRICKNQQLESLYFNKLPLWQHPKDGKVHPQLRNCGTVTRRPAGNNPNFLQISKGAMRTLILPGLYAGDEEERVMISLDFAAQEMLITAWMAKDPVMLDAFRSDPRKDLHSVTSTGFAHTLLPRLGIPTSRPLTYEEFIAGLKSEDKEVSSAFKTVRNKYGKVVSFAILYQSGPAKLAETLFVPENVGKELMDGVYSKYARLRSWQQEVAQFAREHGHSLTAYGNRRHASADLWGDDKGKAKRQERQLANAVIQGTAADILKVLRQRIVKADLVRRYRMRAILPIYDEMTASVPLSLAKDYIMELASLMRICPEGYEPGMEVEASIGLTWGSQEEVGIPSEENLLKAIEALISENQ